jgi:hypothetical protein
MSHGFKVTLLSLFWGAGVLGASGCAQPRLEPPEVPPDTLDDDAFLGYLADTTMVTVEEAYRAVIILAEGADPNQSYDERRAWLEQRDITRAAWDLEPNNYIDQGAVAFMVCKVLEVKGGLSRIMLGSWGLGDRRYAHRELVYRGLMEVQGAPFSPITGGEFAHLLGMADEYMAAEGIYEREAIELAPRG